MPAVAGAGGIDATSLGFGRQTKHPAGRQAPLPHVQHCAGEARVTGLLSNATAGCPLLASVWRLLRIGSARIGLVPPCTSAVRLLTSFKQPIGWACDVVACASARSRS
ncbi:hypothetical protein DF035_36160 [Burkholderia contaminans]|nr:hypothetical protein DF035_36160 [Burkholderia contaminans]